MSLDSASLLRAANLASELFSGPLEQELNAADARLGDGDTGLTLRRFFAQVQAAAEGAPDAVPGELLQACGRAGARATGSSLGTLCAMGLLTAGKHCGQRNALPWAELPELLQSCLEVMLQRGRSALGDKTVLDVLDAAIRSMRGQDDPVQMAGSAARAARQALDDFRPRQSRTGRARMFAERSSGLDDPGMLALASLITALSEHLPEADGPVS